MIEYCPECKERIQPGNTDCSCGWKSNKNAHDERKGFCEWEHEGRECPAIGNHSKSISGGGTWYCIKHLGAVDTASGIKIINDYEKNGIPDRLPIYKTI